MKSRYAAVWVIALVAALALPAASRAALSFNGTNQYVTFGLAKNLGTPAFTLETWFNWSGGGVAATTGNGGVMAIPLIAKMAAEADGDNRDGNYFLGIRTPDGVLVADLEEGARGAAPGTNHPVVGLTAVTSNTWHHVAVTYNGTNWSLFLDGHLETTLTVGQPPRSDTIQHAGLASSLNSGGQPQGFFAGLLDEVRIWNYARSLSQIASNRNVQVRSAPGLLGRWALDETNGIAAHDNSGAGVDGRLVNGPSWINENRSAADVVTPIKLVVIDPERTAVLRQAEAQRMPPLFRFDPGVAQQVENNFRNGFLITRDRFLAALEGLYPHRPPNWKAPTNAAFVQWIGAFQSTNKGFPIGTDIASRWAEGHRASAIQSNLALSLRGVAARYIGPSLLPEEAKLGPATVRFYTLGPSNAMPTLDMVEAQGLSSSRSNLYSVARARLELQQRFSPNDQLLAAYLAGFLKENCVFDPELTRQSRTRHVESLFATDQFDPGQGIVKKGQVIDAKIRAALDEFEKQTATANQIKARVAAEQAKTENALRDLSARTALSEFKSQHFGQENRWLFGGLIIVVVTSSLAVWRLTRFRRARSLVPVVAGRGGDSLMPDGSFGEPPEGVDAAEWRDRALFAEQRAAQTSEVLRAGLLPHLAQWLKQKLVRGLMADRAHLMKIQYAAELELAELDQRLAKLHAPLEERLKVYEQRIVELERELAIKGEENRELIKAKIESTRKKIAQEQGQDPVTWT